MRFPGGRAAKDILERLGGALRDQYDTIVREDPPEALKRLIARLRVRNPQEPKRGRGGPKPFRSR